jgi:hypothetical protein
MSKFKRKYRHLAVDTPWSVPAPIPQPNAPQYPVGVLNNFTELGSPGISESNGYTRDSYYAAYGTDAPPYDETRPIQTWFDSSANPNEQYEYNVLGKDRAGRPALEKKRMPGKDARSVNLYGSGYPAYEIEPTDAYQVVDGNKQPFNPIMLSTKEQANDLMAEWTALGLDCTDLIEAQNDQFPYVYPPDEDRRIWSFTCATSSGELSAGLGIIYTGLEYNAKYQNGVGAPGHWDVSQVPTMGPQWIVEPIPPPPSNPEVIGMPLRDLYENEELILASMGMTTMVKRTDVS